MEWRGQEDRDTARRENREGRVMEDREYPVSAATQRHLAHAQLPGLVVRWSTFSSPAGKDSSSLQKIVMDLPEYPGRDVLRIVLRGNRFEPSAQ